MTKTTAIDAANALRAQLKKDAALADNLLKALPSLTGSSEDAIAEACANAKLSFRHLEDSTMRLGKVIQALEGGVSILDHPEVKAIIEKIRAND